MTAVNDYTADIFIDGETVTTTGKSLDMDADVIIHASGKVDRPHVGGSRKRDICWSV